MVSLLLPTPDPPRAGAPPADLTDHSPPPCHRNCPKCKKARTATKSLSLSRLPPVLLIHLKRFSSKNGVFWDKAETLVEFPVRSLDLTKYLPPPLPSSSSGPDSHAAQMRKAEDPRDQSGPFVYELCESLRTFPYDMLRGRELTWIGLGLGLDLIDGVSNHSGSLSGGHYTAFVKSARRHWKYCDDRTISEADEKDLVVRPSPSLLLTIVSFPSSPD